MQMTLLQTSLLKWIWTAAQFRLCSTVVTQILQHSCYYLVADECYLLQKFGSNLLKLSNCLGFVQELLMVILFMLQVAFQIMTLLGCVQQRQELEIEQDSMLFYLYHQKRIVSSVGGYLQSTFINKKRHLNIPVKQSSFCLLRRSQLSLEA